MTHLEKEISELEDRASVLKFASRDLPSKREKIMGEIAELNHKIAVMKKIERDEAKQKRKGKRRRVKSKGHLYRKGAKKEKLKEFQERYGKVKGTEIYGATVGKIKRIRESHGVY